MIFTTYQKGLISEAIAVLLLLLKGYRILKWRYQTPLGEIDLIACRRGLLVIVEVKGRSNRVIQGDFVSSWQRRRIENALLLFLKSYRVPYRGVRFDLLLVFPYQWPKHIKDAWRTGD